MLANPEARPHIQQAGALAQSELGLYEVVFTNHKP